MDHPGDAWTMASALSLAAWGLGGTAYLKRRLLAPVRADATRAKHQAEMSQSHPDLLTRKLYLAKARGHVSANRQRLQDADHWQRRVYQPVVHVLTFTTVVLAAWGIWGKGW